jgi:hypothetical protein
LYITALKGFLEYLVAEELADINLSKVKLLIRQRTRKPGKRLPQFPQMPSRKSLINLETTLFSVRKMKMDIYAH